MFLIVLSAFIEVTVEERIASICVLVSVALHFAASITTFFGYTERKRKNFKVAGILSFIAGE